MMPPLLRTAIGAIPMGLACFVVLIYLAVIGALSNGQPGNAQCKIKGMHGFVRPDDKCTPGTFNDLTKAEVCKHKDRPRVNSSARRKILRQYGYRHWGAKDGELDHRVPVFLGGRTEEDNLWPEEGKIPNTKDILENKIHTRVCTWNTMTVDQARKVFLGNWEDGYIKYRWP
jgi:hypothetical protein